MDGRNNIDYQRLLTLNQKVSSNSATQAEKDELMLLLYRNNSITRKQYDDYLAGRNIDDILGTALAIAGIVLLGYLLGKLLSK
ncbi:MAG: hypothetical protein LC109_05460 [Bacteroidia bacterium]|nr:hypothetical protein [Bacteroidia bacterium]